MAAVKVINYEFYSLTKNDQFGETVIVNLMLEDGRIFTLYNIPKFIATECIRLIDGYTDDYRKSISEILSEIPELEHAVSSVIDTIIIDKFDEEREIYSATIKMRNGNVKRVIPSHAILLSIIIGSCLYVKEELVEEQERLAQKKYME